MTASPERLGPEYANCWDSEAYDLLLILARLRDGNPNLGHIYAIARATSNSETERLLNKLSPQVKDLLMVNVGAFDIHRALLEPYGTILRRCIVKSGDTFVLSFGHPDDKAIIGKYYQPETTESPGASNEPEQHPR